MHAKNNRQNSNFQIAYFLAGSCHTPDGAYALLRDLEADRKLALGMVEASRLRAQAKRVRAEKKINRFVNGLLAFFKPEYAADAMEGKADISEMEAFAELEEVNYRAAVDEVRFIQQCIEKLQPLRRFKHLPDPEAHQATQRDEWRLELINRAQNFILTDGRIPADQFGTMRMHPDFDSDIYPAVVRLIQDSQRGEPMASITAQPKFLLELFDT